MSTYLKRTLKSAIRDTVTDQRLRQKVGEAGRLPSKPIGVSFDSAAHVVPVIQLFDLALGREGGFRKQPFCVVVLVHVVPPLRYAQEGVEIMREAIAAGMPLQMVSFG